MLPPSPALQRMGIFPKQLQIPEPSADRAPEACDAHPSDAHPSPSWPGGPMIFPQPSLLPPGAQLSWAKAASARNKHLVLQRSSQALATNGDRTPDLCLQCHQVHAHPSPHESHTWDLHQQLGKNMGTLPSLELLWLTPTCCSGRRDPKGGHCHQAHQSHCWLRSQAPPWKHLLLTLIFAECSSTSQKMPCGL